MNLNLKLAPRLTLVFVLFASLLVGGVGALLYISGRDALQAATISELLATALEKESALNAWVDGHREGVVSVAASPAVREAVMTLVTAAPDSPEARAARDRLVAELAPYTGADGEFLALLVLEPTTGQVIAATNVEEEGKFREDQPYFIHGQKELFVQNLYYSPALQAPAMTVATPLRAADGRLLGVLAGRLNLDDLNTIINRRTGLRQTDDAFLVNTSNLFITQPRLLPDPAVLQRGVHTEAVNRCLMQTSGVISANDYRGQAALIVYRWSPQWAWCQIVKLDQSEAFAPARAFGEKILLIGGLTLLAATALAFGLARGITGPIVKLRDGAARIGAGDLEHPVAISGADEIAQLAREFNEMAARLVEKEAQLRGYAAELEQRVEERTAQLRDKERLLSEAQRIAHIGSWDVNLTTNTVIWSEETYRIYGVKPETFGHTTQAFVELIRPADRAAVQGWMGRLLSGTQQGEVHEFRVPLPTGAVRYLRGSGEVIRDEAGVPVRAIGAVQDITAYKQAEDEIHRLNAELEQRVVERTAQLEAANQELEAFSYSVSHDLRAPLRAMDGFSRILLQQYAPTLDAPAARYLQLVRDNARQMGALVDDLLAFSRLGRQALKIRPVAARPVVEDALATLRAEQDGRQVEIIVGDLPDFQADPVLLKQVFINLLSNALKFTRAREVTRIEVGVLSGSQVIKGSRGQVGAAPSGQMVGESDPPTTQPRDHSTIYFIRDNGVGFDNQYAHKLFGVFQRLHRAEDYEGTGVGLAIVARIIHRHGGRVWGEGAVDTGATFYFTLPAEPPVGPADE